MNHANGFFGRRQFVRELLFHAIQLLKRSGRDPFEAGLFPNMRDIGASFFAECLKGSLQGLLLELEEEAVSQQVLMPALHRKQGSRAPSWEEDVHVSSLLQALALV